MSLWQKPGVANLPRIPNAGPNAPFDLSSLNDGMPLDGPDGIHSIIQLFIQKYGLNNPNLYIHERAIGHLSGKTKDSWKRDNDEASAVKEYSHFEKAGGGYEARLAVCLTYAGNWVNDGLHKAYEHREWHCWAFLIVKDPNAAQGKSVFIFDDGSFNAIVTLGQGAFSDALIRAEKHLVKAFQRKGYRINNVYLGGDMATPDNCVFNTFSWIQRLLRCNQPTQYQRILASDPYFNNPGRSWDLIAMTRRNPALQTAERQARLAAAAANPPPAPTPRVTRSSAAANPVQHMHLGREKNKKWTKARKQMYDRKSQAQWVARRERTKERVRDQVVMGAVGVAVGGGGVGAGGMVGGPVGGGGGGFEDDGGNEEDDGDDDGDDRGDDDGDDDPEDDGDESDDLSVYEGSDAEDA